MPMTRPTMMMVTMTPAVFKQDSVKEIHLIHLGQQPQEEEVVVAVALAVVAELQHPSETLIETQPRLILHRNQDPSSLCGKNS